MNRDLWDLGIKQDWYKIKINNNYYISLMGKYLQDVKFQMPALPKKGLTEEKRKTYFERYSYLGKPLAVIETLYNFYLPRKYETGYNIWRFIISFEEHNGKRIEEIGHGADYIQMFDHDFLSSLSPQARKEELLDLFQRGLVEICGHYKCDSYPFIEVYNKIRSKGIVLSEAYRKPKISPNKQYIAKLHTYFSEDEKVVSVLIENRKKEQIQKIKLSTKPFSNFDAITWITNDRFKVSYINQIQSYKRRKVSKDYFEVSLNGQVNFFPVTREILFAHALELISLGEDKLEGVASLLIRAEQAGHGKARNLLNQLKICFKKEENTK